MFRTFRVAFLFLFMAAPASPESKGIDPALSAKAQEGKQQPYLEFGGARVSAWNDGPASGGELGSNRKASQIPVRRANCFWNDGARCISEPEQVTEPNGFEGQVTFYNGRVGYAAFQFTETRDAVVLAQELRVLSKT